LCVFLQTTHRPTTRFPFASVANNGVAPGDECSGSTTIVVTGKERWQSGEALIF
jgi:hypothetical protein